MTFGEMIERVQYTLGMSEIASNDEREIVKDYINEGVVDVIARTRPYSRVINLTASPGTAEHDMSSTIIALVDIILPGVGKLPRYTRGDILDAQAASTPGYAYEEPLLWLSPIFSQPTVIRAYGCFRPTKMTADDQSLGNPTYGGLVEEFQPAVLNYALWKAGAYVQHQGSGEGEKWRIEYYGQDGFGGDIAQIKRILNKRVTPAYTRRPNLARNIGVLSPSGSYMGTNGG